MNKKEIPDIIIGRLPRYLRVLTNLNTKTTNSKELGEKLGYSAAQIRKDLSQFGEFGKQGTGYNNEFLIKQLKDILNLNQSWDILLVGVGNVGRGILNYPGFSEHGFHVTAAVDSDPKIIGEVYEKCTVQDVNDMENIIKSKNIKIAMLAVPADHAQAIAERLVSYGIEAILSYAPIILTLPPNVRVEYSDPIISLEHITYYLGEKE